VGPDYRAPPTLAPQRFVAAASTETAGAGAVDLGRWWRVLGDAELDGLVERAVRANPDIQIALARLQQAREREAALIGSALPQIDASAAAGRGTGSDLTRAGADPVLRAADDKGSLRQIRQVAGFAASWEANIFGGYRRAIEAGRDDVGAEAAARDAVLIGVVADVVRDYLDLRASQSRLAILEQNIAVAQQSRDLEQQRFDRGLINELDLQLAIREYESLAAGRPPLESRIEGIRYDIALLLGEYPEELRDELSVRRALPELPPALAPGLPLQLLQRRPDVRRAERRLAAATARIGVATAELFPHVGLTGALGAQSATLGAHGSHIWGFVPSVYWPLLDFGTLDAEVDVAGYQAQEQLVAYRQTVIGAVRDADTAIAGYAAQRQRLASLSVAIQASERAVGLAQLRYERGLTDFLNVVDAQRQQYDLEDRYVAAEQGAADAFVILCRSLGGGWEHYQEVPPIQRPQPAAVAGFRRLVAGDGARP
jgi:NodT family efflux transporter outer membrane factor (OMF) lipoprotein